MSEDKETSKVDSKGGGSKAGCATTPCSAVSVTITLSAAVACPGHPLAITAVGSPSGGTFSWVVSGGGAQLVNGSGNPVTTGATVNLRSFKPNHATGIIPATNASVTVTYTHPNGTAVKSKTVPVHKIDFIVTNTAISSGITQATESAGRVQLGNAPGIATMSTNPDVEIQLEASCPRKAACAANHQVGWLQTVLTNERRTRYTHTLVSLDPTIMPIRDQISGPIPYYEGVQAFTADKDKKTVHHEDSPGQGAAWTDARPGAAAPPPATNRQLRWLNFSNGFHAWLVVQNIEWKAHDESNSFVYLRNFAWSMRLNVVVDTTQAIGGRCTPASNAATIGALSKGRGGVTPVMTAPFPNVDHTVTTNPALGI